jgi:hypothetical protein
MIIIQWVRFSCVSVSDDLVTVEAKDELVRWAGADAKEEARLATGERYSNRYERAGWVI